MYKVTQPLGLILAGQRKEFLFRAGLIFKIILIIILAPTIQEVWFVDFVRNSIEHPSLDPWSSYLDQGGQTIAFPYGPVMLASHILPVIAGWFLDITLSLDYFSSLGFRISLLLADLALLSLLLAIFKESQRKVLLYYWLSPLAIFITYWHGQTDVIPVALFVCSFWYIQRSKYAYAGIAFALAVGAKYSMLIGLPFILLYIFQNKSIRQQLPNFLLAFIAVMIITQGPYLFSDAFRSMVISNRETDKIYRIALELGENLQIYIVQLVYVLLLYFTWRLKRMNFELLLSVVGASYSIIILLTLAPPGWFFWLLPFYVAHQIRSGSNSTYLISSLSVLFIIFHLANSTGAGIPILEWQGTAEGIFSDLLSDPRIESILYTLIIATGALITMQIMRDGIQHNDYYRISRRPLSLGVAGNSGVGKSTFAATMTKLFGDHSVVHLSGDDYHNWDRMAPMWQTMTHLDPRANHLFQFANDVLKLINGGSVKARQYDHTTGRFAQLRSLKSENVVIASGLHSLYPMPIRSAFDVKFFLDMEEELHVFLKLRRDMSTRGYTSKQVLQLIERRRSDYLEFVKPQEIIADIVFKLLTVNPDLLQENNEDSLKHNLKLEVHIRNGIYYRELVKALVGVCGLQLNVTSLNENGEVILEIQGDVVAEDIRLAVYMLLPHMEELLQIEPEWEDGTLGIMQLIALVEINEVLKVRGRQYQ